MSDEVIDFMNNYDTLEKTSKHFCKMYAPCIGGCPAYEPTAKSEFHCMFNIMQYRMIKNLVDSANGD